MDKQAPEAKRESFVKAHCPTCNAERKCIIHTRVDKHWTFEDREGGFSMDGGIEHSLLECHGCETVFYQSDSWDSENADFYDRDGSTISEAIHSKRTYPSPDNQTKPLWFDAVGKADRQLQSILDEMYVAYDNRAYILTVVGLRTVLDRATEVLDIDPAMTFEEKLTALKDGGWIGSTERDILDVIANAGHAAAHRGWSPNKWDVRKLITAMEAFLHRAFIVGQDALAIRGNIPPKPKRRKPKNR